MVNYFTDIMTICVEISRHQSQSEQRIVSLVIVKSLTFYQPVWTSVVIGVKVNCAMSV